MAPAIAVGVALGENGGVKRDNFIRSRMLAVLIPISPRTDGRSVSGARRGGNSARGRYSITASYALTVWLPRWASWRELAV